MDHPVIRVACFGDPCNNLRSTMVSNGIEISEVFDGPDLDGWEAVLANQNLDAIVFSATQRTSENQDILRTLMQNQIPVAIVSPDADSLFAYELEMIRLDAGGRLAAILPKHCKHSLEATTVQGQAMLSGPSLSHIYEHLTNDLLYLENALGAPKYVFAMGARLNEDVRNLTINVEFDSGCLLNWHVGSPKCHSQFQQDNVRMDFDHEAYSTTSVRQTLEQLADNEWDQESWVRYATTREAAELISISLKKGRRIEIFEGNPTEADSFKGVMSTAGCLILILALVVIAGLAILDIGQISETRDAHLTALESNGADEQERWPLWLRLWPVYPLAVFLAFQFLRLVIRTEVKSR